MQWLTIIISSSALLISLVAVWKNYFSPFRLKTSFDSPTFAIYEITPSISGGKTTWWIPSIDMGFTFHNLGTRSGEVTDVRVVIEVDNKKSKEKFVFYAKWVVNYPLFFQGRTNRMTWIKNSIIRDWYPLILSNGKQQSVHLILEGGRWDTKKVGETNLSLQIYSSQKKRWIEQAKYSHLIVREMYKGKSSYTLFNNNLAKIRQN